MFWGDRVRHVGDFLFYPGVKVGIHWRRCKFPDDPVILQVVRFGPEEPRDGGRQRREFTAAREPPSVIRVA